MDEKRMNEKQIKAAVDYINTNAVALHGMQPGDKLDIGDDITPKNVIEANISGINAVLLVDRGIKGLSKYVIALADIEKGKATEDPAEREAKKVDTLRASLGRK